MNSQGPQLIPRVFVGESRCAGDTHETAARTGIAPNPQHDQQMLRDYPRGTRRTRFAKAFLRNNNSRDEFPVSRRCRMAQPDTPYGRLRSPRSESHGLGVRAALQAITTSRTTDARRLEPGRNGFGRVRKSGCRSGSRCRWSESVAISAAPGTSRQNISCILSCSSSGCPWILRFVRCRNDSVRVPTP